MKRAHTIKKIVLANAGRFSFFAFSFFLLSGCNSVKSFMARDLEDEDFIIGQLYVDEMVKETPVIAKPVSKPTTKTTRQNALGLSYDATDNKELYEAIRQRQVQLWSSIVYKTTKGS